ncbi:MAG TPA: DUF4157 domain-containing protein, partial [Polyangiaceae bacterium]|nr:DUF4157 domain-containing protein [Polyangiaceae bacterium]
MGDPALALAGPGQALPRDVRTRLESSFNANLEAVRVHEGDTAARLAHGQGARAFAYGHHIVLGAGQNVRDLSLIAHEVAHVLQQTGAPAVQRLAENGAGHASVHESEAAAAGQAVAQGQAVHITGHTEGPETQRAEEGGLFGINLGAAVEAGFWTIVEQFAPELVPILRRGPEGVLDWIKDKVMGAIRALIDGALAPVRGISAIGQWLHGQFAPLVAWMQEAAVKIANNDCKPINEAIAKIEEVAGKIVTPIIDKVQLIVGKIGGFLDGVWKKLGLPVWDFLKSAAGFYWEQLQKLGSWIWDKLSPYRRMWAWLKDKLGIGEGPEGQDGIIQWIQRKASAAWDWVMAKIEPYKKQILTVLGVIGSIGLMVSPAGPVVLAGAAIYGVVQAVKWLRAHLGKGDALVKARAYAQTVLIPQMMGAIGRMTSAVTNMAKALSGKLGEFAGGIGQMVGAAAKSALEFLVDAATWLAERALELANWANEKLVALAKWIQIGLERLRVFLQPMLNFLGEVGKLLLDIWGLPLLLAGKLWNLIPCCIRDPFVDWIGPLILRQIEIFKELGKDDQAWQKTKADVMKIIRLVFVTKDLRGAIKATFDLILRVFNVPVELFEQVMAKAQVAWDAVTSAPIKFLKNCVRVVGRGFQLYWDGLWDNLLLGVEGWLFSELSEKGLQRPKSWTDPWELAGFVCSVLGLSVDHVFELMEKAQIFQPETVAKIRVWFGRLSKAWDWIMEMRGKSPQEVTGSILGQAKDFGKAIFEGIVSWVVGKVSKELATMAAAAAASGGLSAVLDVGRRIYKAITSAVRWMRQILGMVNTALDSVLNIAAGTIEPAATLLVGAMKKGTPAVIGFLANQVGLDGIAEKISEIIDKLRAKVDSAIVAILKKVKELIAKLVQG